YFFFFQAEDGIRYFHVTGVQTCALPICRDITEFWRRWHISLSSWLRDYLYIPLGGNRKSTFSTYLFCLLFFVAVFFGSKHLLGRSEERRVGKEGRSLWSRWLYQKLNTSR